MLLAVFAERETLQTGQAKRPQKTDRQTDRQTDSVSQWNFNVLSTTMSKPQDEWTDIDRQTDRQKKRQRLKTVTQKMPTQKKGTTETNCDKNKTKH